MPKMIRRNVSIIYQMIPALLILPESFLMINKIAKGQKRKNVVKFTLEKNKDT